MEKRRNYFIDKSFQTKFIVKFCVINLVACLAIGLLIWLLNRQTNTVAFENLKVVVQTTADFIQPILFMVILVVSFFSAIVTIVVVLFTSHRIAGPLYRLTVELGKIKAKDLSHPIRIRATDQLQKLASECEAMRLEYLRLIRQLKESGQSLRAFLGRSKDLYKDPQERRQLERNLEILESEFQQFKTE